MLSVLECYSISFEPDRVTVQLFLSYAFKIHTYLITLCVCVYMRLCMCTICEKEPIEIRIEYQELEY